MARSMFSIGLSLVFTALSVLQLGAGQYVSGSTPTGALCFSAGLR
jgi:hypothetical protein